MMNALKKVESFLFAKLPANSAKDLFEAFIRNDDMNDGLKNLSKLDHFRHDTECIGELEDIAIELGDKLRVTPFHVLMMSTFDTQHKVPMLNLFYENEIIRSFESFSILMLKMNSFFAFFYKV
jgi:hypothetical protein